MHFSSVVLPELAGPMIGENLLFGDFQGDRASAAFAP